MKGEEGEGKGKEHWLLLPQIPKILQMLLRGLILFHVIT